MFRPGVIAVAGALCIALAATHAPAEESAAAAQLRSKGLRKVGLTFVLPADGELADGVRKARLLRIRLTKAKKEQDANQAEVDRTLRIFLQRRSDLSRRLTEAASVRENNQIVGELNDLDGQMTLLQQEQDKKSKQLGEAFSQARDDFQRTLQELRKLTEEAKDLYAQLAQDAEVSAALADLSQADAKAYVLGPGRSFQQNLKSLQDLESTVLSETVALRSEGGVLWLDTTLNGQFTKSMVLDTGASMVTLPEDFAAQIGLTPRDSDPAIALTLADGRTTQGKMMTLKSVQVGRFTIQNVPCAVILGDKDRIPPLLGGSFLKHFTCNMDPTAGKLTLSKVETSADPSPSRGETPAGRSAR